MIRISLTPVEWYFVPQVLVGGPGHIQFSVAWKHKIYKEPHHSLELKQYKNVPLKMVLTSLLNFQCFLSACLKSTVTLSSLPLYVTNILHEPLVMRVWHNINTTKHCSRGYQCATLKKNWMSYVWPHAKQLLPQLGWTHKSVKYTNPKETLFFLLFHSSTRQ